MWAQKSVLAVLKPLRANQVLVVRKEVAWITGHECEPMISCVCGSLLRVIRGKDFLHCIYRALMIAFFSKVHSHSSLQPSDIDILYLNGCRLLDPYVASGSTCSDSGLNRCWPGHETPGECHVSTLPCRLRPLAADIAKAWRHGQANG